MKKLPKEILVYPFDEVDGETVWAVAGNVSEIPEDVDGKKVGIYILGGYLSWPRVPAQSAHDPKIYQRRACLVEIMQGEICADCGKKIGMLEASYYRKDPSSDMGQSFHSTCGDPIGIRAAVAAERERCAKIADARSKLDRDRYAIESDWRLPYAFNRVIRASLDIAAEIRQKPRTTPECAATGED